MHNALSKNSNEKKSPSIVMETCLCIVITELSVLVNLERVLNGLFGKNSSIVASAAL